MLWNKKNKDLVTFNLGLDTIKFQTTKAWVRVKIEQRLLLTIIR